ncbi:MAG: hypothetical protein ACLQF0_05390 [Dissulfurispiraceae bacterium]
MKNRLNAQVKDRRKSNNLSSLLVVREIGNNGSSVMKHNKERNSKYAHCACRYDHQLLRCGKPNVAWFYDTGLNMLSPGQIRENLAQGDGRCGYCACRAVSRMPGQFGEISPEVAESAIWEMVKEIIEGKHLCAI